MKHFSILTLLLLSISVWAQPKILTQAIIRAKSEITFPENRGGAGGAGDGERGFNFPSSAEGKVTAYIKDSMSKVAMQSDFANTITIIDGKARKTTTLTESMGRKFGFYTTEEDRKEMRDRMDSLRKVRQDSLKKAGVEETQANPFAGGGNREEIIYKDETKKIAGLNCKKAIIRSTNRQGVITETPVWYCPDFKLAQQISLNGGGMFNAGGLRSLDKLNGFPMAYEISRPNGFHMAVEVTKVEMDPKIDDKEFEVPAGYDIKPMKDMRGGQGFGRNPGNG